LVTGSANLMTLPRISELLTGQMTMFEFFRLAEAEI